MKNNNIEKIFSKKNKYPYIIAEIGNNHNGSIHTAKKLIIEAKKSGADCVKFQTFTTNTLFSKKSFRNNKRLKIDSDKFTLKKKSDFKILLDLSKKLKLDFCATPFSFDEVDFLVNELKLKFIKIASMDINNYPFIEYIAKKKIPIIISTGFGNKKEIDTAIKIIKRHNTKVVILHCIAEYPPKIHKLNLNRITTLKKKYKQPVGFSDHTIGIDASLNAVVLGAEVIEKHFTLNKKMKGWDHAISADTKDMTMLVNKSKIIKISLGSEKIFRVEKKSQAIKFKRSIVALKNISKNEKLTATNLGLKRPGDGLPPEYFKKVLGKKTNKNIKYDEQIKMSYLR